MQSAETKSQPLRRASKEECQKAIDALARIKDRSGAIPDIKIVDEFLAAAIKKLPSEAAFDAEAKRHTAAK